MTHPSPNRFAPMHLFPFYTPVWLTVMMFALVLHAHGQFDRDNQTNIVKQKSVTWTDAYYVGSNTAGNVLLIQDAQAHSAGRAVIGHAAGSDNNRVVVSGEDAVWKIDDALIVGFRGAGNTMTIRDGAGVYSDADGSKQGGHTGWVGFRSSGNSITVTGRGSVWSNYWLCIGEWGSQNKMTVADGGSVFSENAWIGRDPGAHKNVVRITGKDSRWENNDTIHVGHYGMRCSLEIEKDARVLAGNVMVGKEFATMGKPVPTGFSELNVSGGALTVTNSKGTATVMLGPSPGRFTLDEGTVTIDALTVERGKLHLYKQYGPNTVRFKAGELLCRNAQVKNGKQFVVGEEKRKAVYRMQGGTHTFDRGVEVGAGSILSGWGTLDGDLVIHGKLRVAGGELVVEDNVTNNGTIEVSADASVVFRGDVLNEGTILTRKNARFDGKVTGSGKVDP